MSKVALDALYTQLTNRIAEVQPLHDSTYFTAGRVSGLMEARTMVTDRLATLAQEADRD